MASLTKLLRWMFIEWWHIQVFVSIIITIVIIIICVYVNYVTCVCAYGFHMRQSDPLEWQEAVSHPVRFLGTELESSGKELYAS